MIQSSINITHNHKSKRLENSLYVNTNKTWTLKSKNLQIYIKKLFNLNALKTQK